MINTNPIISDVLVHEKDASGLSLDYVTKNAKLLQSFTETSENCEWEKTDIYDYEIKVLGDYGHIRTETARVSNAISIDVVSFSIPESFKLSSSSPDLLQDIPSKIEIKRYPRLNCLDQNSDKLAKEIKNLALIPPPEDPIHEEMILHNIHAFSENSEDEFLDQIIFHGLKNGFFVEAGAADFIFHSTSLHFEMIHSWSGLLVEVQPHFVQYGYKSLS